MFADTVAGLCGGVFCLLMLWSEIFGTPRWFQWLLEALLGELPGSSDDEGRHGD